MSSMDSELSGLSLWDFAAQIYSVRGVSAACLRLQDRLEIDVCVFLSCLWSAHRGYAGWSPQTMGALLKTSKNWQTPVVKPLRMARDNLKARAMTEVGASVVDLRKSILEAELAAEKLELAEIEALFAQNMSIKQELPVRREVALSNINAYLGAAGHRPDVLQVADHTDIQLVLDVAVNSGL